MLQGGVAHDNLGLNCAHTLLLRTLQRRLAEIIVMMIMARPLHCKATVFNKYALGNVNYWNMNQPGNEYVYLHPSVMNYYSSEN